jgi:hypothetical protein
MIRTVACLSLLTLSVAATAQETPAPEAPQRAEVYRDVTVLDIDDPTLVDASLNRPGIISYLETTRGAHPPMIRLRESFRAEMRDSVEAMK